MTAGTHRSLLYTKTMIKGFKEFLAQGNVMDLAVAVIIGAAFTQVVTALTDSVLMPLISALVGSPNFDEFAKVTLNVEACVVVVELVCTADEVCCTLE